MTVAAMDRALVIVSEINGDTQRPVNVPIYLDATILQSVMGCCRAAAFDFIANCPQRVVREREGGRGRPTVTLVPLTALEEKYQAEWRRRYGSDLADGADRSSLSDDLEAYNKLPENIRKKIGRRKAIVEKWLLVKSQAGDLMAARGDFAIKNGVSPDTLYRWERAYNPARPFTSLAPEYSARIGVTKLGADRAEEMIAWYCDKKFGGRTMAMTFTEYDRRCRERREKPVSERSIYNILSTDEVKLRKQRSVQGDRKFFDQDGDYVSRTRVESYPGHAYVGDHQTRDVKVISKNRKRIVRPVTTLWIDYYSKRRVGYRNVENGNTDSIRLSFLDACADFGVPKICHSDNGKDYLAEALGDVYDALYINKVLAWLYNAKTKIIERVHGFIAMRFDRSMPGWCGNSTETRTPEHDRLVAVTEKAIADGRPLGRAHGTLLTWEEFEAEFAAFMNEYDRTITQSEGIEGKTPIQAWEEHPQKPVKMTEEALALMLLKKKPGTVRRGRVHLLKKKFRNWEALCMMPGRKVILRYDPANLSQCYVYDAADGHLICIAYAEQKGRAFVPEDTEANIAVMRRANKLLNRNTKEKREIEKQLRDLTLGIASLPPDVTPPSTTAGRERIAASDITGLYPALDGPARETKRAAMAANGPKEPIYPTGPSPTALFLAFAEKKTPAPPPAPSYQSLLTLKEIDD